MLSIFLVYKTLMNYWSVRCQESAQQTWPQSLCDGHACDNELLKRSLLLAQVEGAEYEELTALHESVYQQSVSWFASLQDHMREQILSHFGLMPDREPEPQVSCPFFFCHAVISCRNVLRHIMLGKTWQYLLCCLFHYGRLWTSSFISSPKKPLV